MHHPFDLANVIAGDHRLAETLFERLEQGQGDRQRLIEQVIQNVAIHAGAEELVFYPALEDNVPDGAEIRKDDLAAHQPIKDALVVLDHADPDSTEAAEALQVVIDGVRSHARDEEDDQLVRLREAVGDDTMVELGESFRDHAAKAPTRAHPHTPTNAVTATGAGLVDKVRDKVQDRDMVGATDASGLLDPQAQELVDRFGALGPLPPHLLPAKLARKQPTLTDAVLALMKERDIEGPEPVAAVEDLKIPGPDGDIEARVYRGSAAADADGLPVIVYIHGGGWVIADLDTYDASCRGLANQTGAIVVSVEYRHAPEHPFPAAHDDVLAATRWVLANAADLGGDPFRVAIAGESAGGNMAAATSMALVAEAGPRPVFQLLVYPVTSTAMDTPSYSEAADAKPLYSAFMGWFFGRTIHSTADLSDGRLDLLSCPDEALRELPPTLVITAGRDPLRDEGEAFAERLREAGVAVQATRYEGMPHEFFGAASVLDKAAQAQTEAARALRNAFTTSHQKAS